MKFKKNIFRKDASASEVLEEAMNHHTDDKVSIGELIYTLHERGFGLLMLIFVLPNCVPIPIPPGMSTIFSVPLIFLSIQMLIGMDAPWLPLWLKQRTIERQTLAKAISKASPRLKKIEKLLKPRLEFLDTKLGEKIIGFFWLIFAISIAVPLPMTNFIPGVGILIMSLGLLSKDGFFAIAGIFIGILGVCFTIGVLWVGKEAVFKLLSIV